MTLTHTYTNTKGETFQCIVVSESYYGVNIKILWPHIGYIKYSQRAMCVPKESVVKN